MSFINRKIISKATFAMFLTATVLASCSSNDSSSTGRTKNSAIDGQLCYYDAERANLLLTAKEIPAVEKVDAQDAVVYRAKVEYRAAVPYQAARTGTALVLKGSISAEVAAVPEFKGQAAVAFVPGSFYIDGSSNLPTTVGVATVEMMLAHGWSWIVKPTSFRSPNGSYTWREGTPGQDAIPPRPEIPFQAAVPPQDIPAGNEIPEILAVDEILARDEIPFQAATLEVAAVEGKSLGQVKDEINAVAHCESPIGNVTLSGGSSSPSVPVAAQQSPAPAGLSVTAGGFGVLTLDWQPGTHSGDTYRVYWGTDSRLMTNFDYTETPSNSLTVSVDNGTKYYFRVAGWNSGSKTATTDWSDTVSGTPVASSATGGSSSDSAPVVSSSSPATGDSSSSSAPSGPALPVCISGADKDSALAGYDEQIKLHEKDADLKWYNELLNGRNNVAGREICTGTEVSKVVLVAVQATVDQPPAQASVPAAVLTVEKPVVLLNEVVTEVVVASTEVQELVAVAGFVEGTVEVQVENAEGLSDWLMIDPSSSNTVELGDGAISIKYRVTSKDASQPVVEKTVEIARLSFSTEVKVIGAADEAAAADQSALNPTVEVEKSSGSKTVIWVAILIMLLIVILMFGMQKKKKDDANSNAAA